MMKQAFLLLSGIGLIGCGQAEPMAVVNQTSKPATRSTPIDKKRSQPVEVGRVDWLRNLDEAKKVAKAADKPILLLFQEIPG